MIKIEDGVSSLEKIAEEKELKVPQTKNKRDGVSKWEKFLNSYNSLYEKHIPKYIEDLLIKNGFIQSKSRHLNNLYERCHKGKKEVFLYGKDGIILACISKNREADYGVRKIINYQEGKELSILERWLVAAVWTADIMGPLVLAGRAITTKCNFNCENTLLTVLKSFFEGGVLGAALWRVSWYVHNKRTFKEGKEALEYISGDKFTKDYKSYI